MNTGVSFIISIDSSYEMLNNFFEHFLQDDFVQRSEIIIVDDCTYNSKIKAYLEEVKKKHNNMFIFRLDVKAGYGVANNYGVKKSSNDILFFINTDIFATENCFNEMLMSLQNHEIHCVQPLLLWPQNKRIQCAGSTFGYYYKNHLFAGRKLDTIDLSIIPRSRLALTSALYGMRKKDFYQYNAFDEFYYNKLESFELSLKFTLDGKTCICNTDAIAYHSQGAGRNQYYLDFYQQEAYFWTHFGTKIVPDIAFYYNLQITETMLSHSYYGVAITQTRKYLEQIQSTKLSLCGCYEIQGINPQKINLYDLLPYSFYTSIVPLLFIVENITNLSNNKQWFEQRENDLVIDTYGNLLYVKNI